MSTNFPCLKPFNKQNKETFDSGRGKRKLTKRRSKYLCVGQCKQFPSPPVYRCSDERHGALPNRRRMSAQKFAFIVFSCSRRFCLFGISNISSFFFSSCVCIGCVCVCVCIGCVCVFVVLHSCRVCCQHSLSISSSTRTSILPLTCRRHREQSNNVCSTSVNRQQ